MSEDIYTKKNALREIFFSSIPKARKISPVFRGIFDFMYEAHLHAGKGKKVLNVYASHDFSGEREHVYQDHFFKECEYHAVDFWKDSFKKEGESDTTSHSHTLPYADADFDILVNTKIVLEHVSEPEAVVREFARVLKKDGELFLIAPLVRRQHQVPYDYFRFTEYGLKHLLEKSGFEIVTMTPTNGFMATAASYAYFFQRGLGAPKFIEKFFDAVCYWIIEPVGYALDRLDNGYGRDMTLYFLVQARKK